MSQPRVEAEIEARGPWQQRIKKCRRLSSLLTPLPVLALETRESVASGLESRLTEPSWPPSARRLTRPAPRGDRHRRQPFRPAFLPSFLLAFLPWAKKAEREREREGGREGGREGAMTPLERKEMERWSLSHFKSRCPNAAGRARAALIPGPAPPALLSIVDEYSVLRAAVVSGHPEQTEVPSRPCVCLMM